MKHKKTFTLILLSLMIFLFACEKDDVCLGTSTPEMVMRFYDFNTHELKPTTQLTVVTLPSKDTLFKEISIDSIAIPLDVNQHYTEYLFIENNNPDTLKITYDLNPYFVSKACGYIMFFDQLNVEIKPDPDVWIKQIEIIQNQIQTDTSAHVKIYH
jgi:hypothetical protein